MRLHKDTPNVRNYKVLLDGVEIQNVVVEADDVEDWALCLVTKPAPTGAHYAFQWVPDPDGEPLTELRYGKVEFITP